MVPQISKTDWFFMKQKRRKATRHRMEAKLSRRPTHRTDSASEAAAADSVRLPAENDFCLKIFVQ
jgi:hypothetical protein